MSSNDAIYKDLRMLIDRKNKQIEELEANLEKCQISNRTLQIRLQDFRPHIIS